MRVSVYYLCDELMTGSTGKTVVPALKFEIRTTNAGAHETKQRKACISLRNPSLARGNSTGFEVNFEH